MSILSENLKDLLAENNLDHKTFAANTGISESRITEYIRNEKLPTLKNLIIIADYFNCSTDYLLGLEYEKVPEVFYKPEPFSQRLAFLKDYFKLTHKDIYNNDGITKSRYFEWLNGKRQPSVDNVIKLARIFKCSVDFVIGREK